LDNAGAALRGRGGPSGFASGALATPASADWLVEGTWPDGGFGTVVESGRSLYGDALPEVAVGAPYDTTEGSVSVFYNGAASGLATTPSVVLRGEHPNYNVGTGARMLPRFNGDAWADLAIHGNVTNPEPVEGRIFLHFGSVNGIAPVASWWAESDVRGGVMGLSNRFDGGDLDGDGFTDLAAGCPGWPGDALQNDQPGAVMGWNGTRRSQLRVSPTVIAPGDALLVEHHGSKVGGMNYVQLYSIDGVLVLTPPGQSPWLTSGTADAERCFVTGLVSTATWIPGHVYALRVLARSDTGAVLRSNTVDVVVQ
jgi:hypothetical protein